MKNKKSLLRLGVLLASSGLAVSSMGQMFDFNTNLHSVRSGTGDTAGTDISLFADGSQATFYINDVQAVGGSSWDPNFNVSFNGSYYDNATSTFGNYVLGTAISGAIDWSFGDYFSGMMIASMSGTVAPGVYSTTYQILGGSTDTSSDVLYSFTQTIEVVTDYGLVMSSPDTFFTLNVGDTALVRHQLANPGTRDFLAGSRYLSWSETGFDQFNVAFDFTNYPSVLTPGYDQLVNHATFTALPNPYKTFTFNHGIIGGFYADDANWIHVGSTTLNPVPEPATMAALGLGVLALARRRRK